MEQQLPYQPDLSTEAQPGSYTSDGRTRRHRREIRANRTVRIKKWLACNANDQHINDRLACGLVHSDFTTKHHLVIASESLREFGQIYYQGHDANVNAGVDHAVFLNPSWDERVPQLDEVTPGHGTTQAFPPGSCHGHKGDADRDNQSPSYQKRP